MTQKRILVVSLHFDDSHQPVRRKNKLPQAMGAAFLAGAFSPVTCDIRVYSELYSGPLEDEQLLGWPDMIVVTGVTNCFDRMLHITAYAKTKNDKVIVVAGGAAIRALPLYASRFFDYCCLGDIEQLQEVVRDALGRRYVSDEMIPRLDLAYWIGMHGHVESSRNCNFSCNFCSLTGEKQQYKKYSLDSLRRQLEVMGKRRTVHFIDNNFYGNDRDFFVQRLQLIDQFRRRGHFKYWSAILSSDFFLHDENIRLARETGCCALFTGVESFDVQSLKNYSKLQNTLMPQVEIITRTLNHSIAFWYGLVMDVYSRTVADLRAELEYIVDNPTLALPGFLTIPIPLLGTPYFLDCLRGKRFFPNTKLRHMDGKTLIMQPRDEIGDVVAFIEFLKTLKGLRRKVMKHGLLFGHHYRRTFNAEKMVYALASNALITMNLLCTANTLRRGPKQTHISSTEKVESTFRPKFRVAAHYQHYFSPVQLTDEAGAINEALMPDFESYSSRPLVAPKVLIKDAAVLN